jgi:hypothetical protein
VKFPRLSLLLLTTAIVAWSAGAMYTWFADPEMKFWAAAAKQKLDWVEKMREKHGYVIGVVGGSTTMFGIDAEYIEREHGLPITNLGLHVGMGPAALIGIGLSSLRRGDTLVLSLEPGILTEEYAETSKLGSKLSFILGKPEMLTLGEHGGNLPAIKSLADLSPGGYHVMTMLGKLVMRMPPYRYSIENLRPGGLQVTEERRDFTTSMDLSNPSGKRHISKQGVEILNAAVSAANARGIDVVYALPWSYWPVETADERRAANALFTDAVAQIVPVLCEQSWGVHSELADFSDSGQHLTADASMVRSASLAHGIEVHRNPGSDHVQHAE